MTLNDRLENVAVIGAAGKMGSGIALLMAHEMTMQKLQPEGELKNFQLNLIDISSSALEGLLKYLRIQAVKLAERSIVNIRDRYASRKDLVENHEIIGQFVDDLFLNLRTSTELSTAKDAKMIFEAVLENVDLKISILKKLN